MKKPDHIPSVKAVMTPFPWYIHIEDRLSHASQVMAEHGIRHLPVTRGGELVGVVSERDIRLLESATSDDDALEKLAVGDACVLDAFVVELSAPLDRVLLEMARRHIGSALVVKGGKLVGIFTATDACHAFGEFLRAMFPEARGDDAA